MSAVLARGDLNVAATCTVTYVDAKQLLACGHPITQFGNISIPMTKAEVLATLPSPMNAFKIVNTTETVGSFTQDRANAVAGTFGLSARMIPVSVEVTSAPGSGLPSQSLHFEVLDNRQLTPQVMLASIFQSLSGTNTAANEMTLHLSGEIALRRCGHHPAGRYVLVGLDGAPAAAAATQYVAQRFLAVYENDLQQPHIDSVKIRAIAVPRRESAELEAARLSTDEAHPGDTITVEATVRSVPGQRAHSAHSGGAADHAAGRLAAHPGERWTFARPSAESASKRGCASDRAFGYRRPVESRAHQRSMSM